MIQVGLFIPCYIDQLYPQVAIASLELLEKLGCEVYFPTNQTCCGQPLANAGYVRETTGSAQHFNELFADCEWVVCPSGSCTLHTKEHLPGTENPERIMELSQFLMRHFQNDIRGTYPHKVGIHNSCHALRGLHLGTASELMLPRTNNLIGLLSVLENISFAELTRTDECCGFGGTFSVKEEDVSVQMGLDRLQDHAAQDVDIVTSTDVSCLMHLEGIASRKGSSIKFLHFAEILNQSIK